VPIGVALSFGRTDAGMGGCSLRFLTWFLFVQIRTRRFFRQSIPIDADSLPVDFYQLKRLAGVRKPVFLMTHPKIPLPAAWGIVPLRAWWCPMTGSSFFAK